MPVTRLLCVAALALAACGDDAQDTPCLTDADCTLPAMCAIDGRCAAPSPAVDGKPCAHPDHCESGLCYDTGKGGICATVCEEPAGCKVGQVCLAVRGQTLPVPAEGGKPAPELRLLCQGQGAGTLHLGEACTGDAECGSGLCQSDRCSQVCKSGCPGRMACEQTTISAGGASLKTGVCRRAKLLDILELGAVDIPATGLASPLTFTIEAGVESFLLMADDKDNLHLAITKLEGPDGAVLVNRADHATELMRAFEYTGTATTQVPGTDNPKGAVKPGIYKLWLQTMATDQQTAVAGKVERVAVLMRNSAQKGGLLDLDLHFAPGTGLTAAAAPTDPFVQGTLTQLQALYSRMAGVGLGQVRYYDLPATADVIKEWADVIKVRVDHAKPGPNNLTASVFLVHDIQLGYKALAGGIPGVPGLTGRPISGVVSELQPDAGKMGRLLAHELLHFLGLYHTTESEKAPFKHDTISDTPECATGTAIADCPDYQNQMFPYHLQAPNPPVLSRGQGSVVRGSPFLYEVAYPEACGAGTEVVDVTTSLFASGTTTAATGQLQSACGGTGSHERVHLLRLTESGLKSLEVDVLSADFDPVVYVLSGSCDGKGAELSCQNGQKGAAVKTSVDAPETGAYYIVVDSDSGSGNYTLAVRLAKP